jgi:hypothetical protein
MSSPSTTETVTTGAVAAPPQPGAVADEAPEFYDRSSLRRAFMVAMFDQTEEDFFLWADPLPNARRCLDAILAGPPN